METMNQLNKKNPTSPILRTKKFSTHHIEIFKALLITGKTNRSLNAQFGYSKNSHLIVDHSRKVMYKLLALEDLSKNDYKQQIVFPRKYQLWWMSLLNKHAEKIVSISVVALYY